MTDNKPTTPQSNGNADIGGFETVTAAPYYDCSSKGVYYHTFDTDKSGNVTEKPPQRLSDAIYLIGYGIDDAGKHYRVIQWTDRLQRERKTTALPMSDIGTNWGQLQGMGIAIVANRRKRELLADYLMTEGAKTRHLITNQAGWVANNSAYVLPSGEVITADEKDAPRIIYNGDTSQAQYYGTRGTLDDWQQQIARYAAGNSRLCLVLGVAFAAPFMRLLDIEGGGFHLFGDSSDGKTTAAKVALSVWGKADDLKLSWEGTGHGFSNIANAKNDNLMVLDEIGQASPRVVAHTAYSVINGTGKVQGAKEGGNRHINRWRVLVLSTGEKTLEGFLKAGKGEWHAGQANRLPSIPASAGKGYGVFDTLHDQPNGAALSEHLSHVSNKFYGVAGVAFIKP